MLKLEKGRPADCAGRLEKEVRTYDFLDKLNIEYERIDHEAAMTMEKHMLSTEIKVALCSDGISAFRESDWIGYNAAFANPAHIRAAIATPAFPAP